MRIYPDLKSWICYQIGNTYSVIYSTFRNIDALVEGKNLGVNNSEHQHGAVESQNARIAWYSAS